MTHASYFERLDEHRFRPTEHTGGAWQVDEQHVSPLGGLIVHAIERFVELRGADDLFISRITFDILGVLAIEPFDLTVEVVRPGRTVELLEAVVSARGRAAVRARVWRLARSDTSGIAGGGPSAAWPAPETLDAWPFTDVWPGGYIASLDVRPIGRPTPGHARVWVTTDVPLLADEAVSDLARYVGLLDTANGIAARQPPTEWHYPNVDLSVHLFRQPEGRWVGLDTTAVIGPDGRGLTSSDLYDLAGSVGRAEQSLTIRPLPAR